MTELANLGHQIASLEKFVGDAVVQNGPDLAMFNNKTFVYNNMNYDMGTLVNDLQLVQDSNGAYTPQYSQSLIGQFYTLQASIQVSMTDPQLKSYVGSLSQNVMMVGDTVENLTRNVLVGSVPYTSFNQTAASWVGPSLQNIDASILYNSGVSGVTNTSSASICTAQGTATDTGTYCSP